MKKDINWGLYKKYNVSRVDGRDAPGGDKEGAEYFVLDLTHDSFAYYALMEYIRQCKDHFPNLAEDLRGLICDVMEKSKTKQIETWKKEKENLKRLPPNLEWPDPCAAEECMIPLWDWDSEAPRADIPTDALEIARKNSDRGLSSGIFFMPGYGWGVVCTAGQGPLLAWWERSTPEYWVNLLKANKDKEGWPNPIEALKYRISYEMYADDWLPAQVKDAWSAWGGKDWAAGL
ncbi:MAG: hypothetical protein WC824_14320, partial [Bacteroidota bacterium]